MAVMPFGYKMVNGAMVYDPAISETLDLYSYPGAGNVRLRPDQIPDAVARGAVLISKGKPLSVAQTAEQEKSASEFAAATDPAKANAGINAAFDAYYGQGAAAKAAGQAAPTGVAKPYVLVAGLPQTVYDPVSKGFLQRSSVSASDIDTTREWNNASNTIRTVAGAPPPLPGRVDANGATGGVGPGQPPRISGVPDAGRGGTSGGRLASPAQPPGVVLPVRDEPVRPPTSPAPAPSATLDNAETFGAPAANAAFTDAWLDPARKSLNDLAASTQDPALRALLDDQAFRVAVLNRVHEFGMNQPSTVREAALKGLGGGDVGSGVGQFVRDEQTKRLGPGPTPREKAISAVEQAIKAHMGFVDPALLAKVRARVNTYFPEGNGRGPDSEAALSAFLQQDGGGIVTQELQTHYTADFNTEYDRFRQMFTPPVGASTFEQGMYRQAQAQVDANRETRLAQFLQFQSAPVRVQPGTSLVDNISNQSAANWFKATSLDWVEADTPGVSVLTNEIRHAATQGNAMALRRFQDKTQAASEINDQLTQYTRTLTAQQGKMNYNSTAWQLMESAKTAIQDSAGNIMGSFLAEGGGFDRGISALGWLGGQLPPALGNRMLGAPGWTGQVLQGDATGTVAGIIQSADKIKQAVDLREFQAYAKGQLARPGVPPEMAAQFGPDQLAQLFQQAQTQNVPPSQLFTQTLDERLAVVKKSVEEKAAYDQFVARATASLQLEADKLEPGVAIGFSNPNVLTGIFAQAKAQGVSPDSLLAGQLKQPAEQHQTFIDRAAFIGRATMMIDKQKATLTPEAAAQFGTAAGALNLGALFDQAKTLQTTPDSLLKAQLAPATEKATAVEDKAKFMLRSQAALSQAFPKGVPPDVASKVNVDALFAQAQAQGVNPDSLLSEAIKPVLAAQKRTDTITQAHQATGNFDLAEAQTLAGQNPDLSPADIIGTAKQNRATKAQAEHDRRLGALVGTVQQGAPLYKTTEPVPYSSGSVFEQFAPGSSQRLGELAKPPTTGAVSGFTPVTMAQLRESLVGPVNAPGTQPFSPEELAALGPESKAGQATQAIQNTGLASGNIMDHQEFQTITSRIAEQLQKRQAAKIAEQAAQAPRILASRRAL